MGMWLCLLVMALHVTWNLVAPPVAAAGDTARDLWVVSSRRIVCSDVSQLEAADFDVWRYDAAECAWEDASLKLLFAAPERPTWIWVHGNRVPSEGALAEGLAWDETVRELSGAPDRPFRLIVWSWPADQIRGQLRDVRAKADRADWEADYLGWFLAQLPADRPTALLGFSYGSRIVTGSLHRLEGRRRWKALLLAAATPSDWLLTGCPHGNALGQVDRLYLMVNSCDRALKRFHMVDRCTRPCALGYVGSPSAPIRPAWSDRLEQRDGTDAGAVHDMWAYRSAGSTRSAVGEIWEGMSSVGRAAGSVRQPLDQLDRAERDRLVRGVRVGESSPR